MSFVKRRINVIFAASEGQIGTTGSSDTVTITGLRVEATIVKAGGIDKGSAQIRIFGLSPQIMAKFSTYGAPPGTATQNAIQVSASNEAGVMCVVASGTITQAWADYSQMPEVAFNVEVIVAQYQAIKPAPPTSISKPVDVATQMAAFAKTMGYTFENNGVQATLNDPYFWGTTWTQASECAAAANINWTIDNGTLAIWPLGSYRAGDTVLLSPTTGMIGYPTFTQGGVLITALLNPYLKFGARIQVQSSLPNASGIWAVYAMTYELASETPDGPWFMRIEALKPNFVPNA